MIAVADVKADNALVDSAIAGRTNVDWGSIRATVQVIHAAPIPLSTRPDGSYARGGRSQSSASESELLTDDEETPRNYAIRESSGESLAPPASRPEVQAVEVWRPDWMSYSAEV